MNKKIKIIAFIISSFIILIPVCFLICEWRINYFYSLPYKESNLEEIAYNIKRPNGITYKNLTYEINELTGYEDYTLQFGELYGDVYGKV